MGSGDRRGVVDIQFKFTNASFVCCIGKVDAHATIVVVVVLVLRVVCVIKVLYLIVVYTVFRSSVSRCGEFLIAVFTNACGFMAERMTEMVSRRK